ncbi:MAG: anion permease [Deltaproteobacteria bacterium]|nr:anion permease [Deltaproteobacteria bacterium]
MTLQIALVLFILGAAVLFLVTEWMPMEVVALLVLGSLAVTGLVSPTDALKGFSNPAVITVWAVFILSGGLTRTGVGNIIGNRVVKLAGGSDTLLVMIVMVVAGLMSAFMNNVAVAALMLPVVMDICRSTERSPAALLMPLAYGSLLGGLLTQIGTPPNILVSALLRENQLKPFGLFDFTPVGSFIFVAGVLFMTFVGRRLLPRHNFLKDTSGMLEANLDSQYRMEEQVFRMGVPLGSPLAGKTLAETRMGTVLGMDVIALSRETQSLLAPGPREVLHGGDILVLKGSPERLKELQLWEELINGIQKVSVDEVFSKEIQLVELTLGPDAFLNGKTLNEMDFRNRFQAVVLAVLRDKKIRRANLQDDILRAEDTLLLQGTRENIESLCGEPGLTCREVDQRMLNGDYQLNERLMLLTIPLKSPVGNRALKESRLAEVLGMHVLCIIRKNGAVRMPDADEILLPGDQLIMEGRMTTLNTLRGFQTLEMKGGQAPDLKTLVSDKVGMVETILSPHATLAGKTLRQLHFREKFGLNVLAIFRRGRAHATNLRDMALDFGDALLLYGPREKLNVLGKENDFIVLTQSAQEAPRLKKAPLSSTLMAATFVPVILGWVPIYIATVIGAALMVLFRCLTMEEAYRAIEWKAVFLIAGMFPLGTALDQSGAAKFLAEGVVSAVGPYGPTVVMLALLVLTFLATCVIPTAALVLLLAPIILNASQQMGITPYGFMMAMAMAASASFMTPISHPANILVMGPGGYRFKDYMKVGGLLTLVVLIIIMVVVPIFWPLAPLPGR